MPTIQSQLESAFRSAIKQAFDLDADPLLSVGQNEKFGDYQSNAAMGLAKELSEQTGQKVNPRQVAEQIKSKLSLGDMASEIAIAGPGFINVRLNPAWLAAQVKTVVSDPQLAIELAPSRQKVVVDYSGPNIAKQMHVGHLRSTIIGDCISRALEFIGDDVIRQNHIGDWGTQFGMLIQRKLEIGAGIGDIGDLEDEYRDAKQRFDTDPAFSRDSRQRVVELQAGDENVRNVWRSIVDETRRHYQPIYQQLNVQLRQEHERGESFYNPFLEDIVHELKDKSIAVESEGATVVFVPGYENPLIIQKSDGGFLYGTTDLAAIRFRVRELNARRIIYTHDSRQSQHFAQVFWTARQAGWAPADRVSLEYAPFGTMLGPDGRPFKTRDGQTIKLKDLLDEACQRALAVVTEKSPELPESQRRQIATAVGIGAVKYADLVKDRISDYLFSWDKMLAMDGNTAPYLQYAYARIRSIFRKSSSEIRTDTGGGGSCRAEADDAQHIGSAGASPSRQASPSHRAPSSHIAASVVVELDSPFELALVKHALRFGEIIEAVARELKPHHLCNYLYDLATRFSSFYENCPVLQSEEPIRSSRLLLCDMTAKTMALGLDLLGIEHPEQM